MLKVRVTRQALKHHFEYRGWAYVLLPILMIVSWNLIYTLTAYRPPEDKVLSLYLTGSYVESEKMEALETEVMAQFPQMEAGDFMNIQIEDANDIANNQRFTTYMYAAQGDVYILHRQQFELYAPGGAFLPLDGLIDTTIDLSATTLAAEDDDQPHVYGVPADSLYGFMEKEGYDNRDMVIVVMAYTTNPDESVKLVQWLVDQRTAPKPDFVDRMEPRKPFFPEGFFDEIKEPEE